MNYTTSHLYLSWQISLRLRFTSPRQTSISQCDYMPFHITLMYLSNPQTCAGRLFYEATGVMLKVGSCLSQPCKSGWQEDLPPSDVSGRKFPLANRQVGTILTMKKSVFSFKSLCHLNANLPRFVAFLCRSSVMLLHVSYAKPDTDTKTLQ